MDAAVIWLALFGPDLSPSWPMLASHIRSSDHQCLVRPIDGGCGRSRPRSGPPSATSRAADTPAPSPDKLDRITEFFNNEIASGKLPGAVVLIQQHGKPVYLKCFGVQDVATKTPMTSDTIFALHSMTKPITSLAAMMLIDAGKMSLSDPASKFIPGFADVKVIVGRRAGRNACSEARSGWTGRSRSRTCCAIRRGSPTTISAAS